MKRTAKAKLVENSCCCCCFVGASDDCSQDRTDNGRNLRFRGYGDFCTERTDWLFI